MKTSEKVTIPTKCPVCKSETNFYLDREKWKRWQNGELIQRVFPELTASEREQLITGYCEECWDKLWAWAR